MINWNILSISFLISCIVSFTMLPLVRNWVHKQKKLTEDNNKFQKPRITSLDGLLSVLIFFMSISILLTIATIWQISVINLNLIFISLLTLAVIAMLGFIDDIIGFPNKYIKYVFFTFALVPTFAVIVNNKYLDDNQVNSWQILIYLLAPILIALTAMLTNAVKSFNKINLTSGLIVTGTLLTLSVFENNLNAAILLSTLGGILLFLQIFNYSNIKLSLGSVGRLSFGVVIGVSAVFMNELIALLILMIPYAIYYAFFKSKFDAHQKALEINETEIDSPEKIETHDNTFLYITFAQILATVVVFIIQFS